MVGIYDPGAGILANATDYIQFPTSTPNPNVNPVENRSNPCAGSVGAPDPSWYASQIQQAGNQFPSWDVGSNASNEASTLLGFQRGGVLDAQPTGATRAYGNYVYGVGLAAGGYSLGVALLAADLYSIISNAQYPGQQMDSKYQSLPADNVANITAGYNAQKNGTVCHK